LEITYMCTKLERQLLTFPSLVNTIFE